MNLPEKRRRFHSCWWRFFAVFSGMEFGSARRAEENSTAIHRWAKAHGGMSPAGTTEVIAGLPFTSEESSFVPAGLVCLRHPDPALKPGLWSVIPAGVPPCVHWRLPLPGVSASLGCIPLKTAKNRGEICKSLESQELTRTPFIGEALISSGFL